MKKSNLILLLMGFAVAIILQLRPIADFDIFWQIKIGQLMLEQGALITRDPFTYTHSGELIPVLGWIAQLVFAGAYKVCSWRGVQWVHAGLMAAAYAIAGWSAIQSRMRIFSVVCAVVIGFLVGYSNSNVRPQSFALCCFALMLFLVCSDMKVGLRIFALVPVLLIWQNSHPSVSLGFLLLSVMAVVGWVRFHLDMSKDKPWGITAACLIGLAAQFVSPIGFDIIPVAKANADIARSLRVNEWLPAWHPGVVASMIFFWLALAFFLPIFLKRRKELKVDQIIIFLVMTALTIASARFALFWGVAMIPIFARLIDSEIPDRLFRWPGNSTCSRPLSASVVLGAFCVAIATPMVCGQPVFADRIPVEGIAWLKTVLPAGRIYNTREYGGPLILNGRPEWKIAIDGRLYMYGKDEWKRYAEESTGKLPLESIVKEARPDAFFLQIGPHQPLIDLLRKASNWREVYSDAKCVIFLPIDWREAK